MGNGTFQNVTGEKGHFILLETGHSIPWERFFRLGIGPLILWEWGHPLGNGTRYPLKFGPLILWETSSGNRDFGNWFLAPACIRGLDKNRKRLFIMELTRNTNSSETSYIF